MRLSVVIVAGCCLLGFASAYRPEPYHEKTRFDRSINYGTSRPTRVRIINKKPRIFTDLETHHTVYKDAHLNVCYLEHFNSNDLNEVKYWRDIISNNKNDFYASERSLTKVEAWRIAGGRIVDFCKGMKIIALDRTTSQQHDEDPFFNALPEDENDIIQKRVADVVLNPLRARAKRHAIMEEREKVNEEFVVSERKKREAMPNRDRRFRGQTQSQYMNVGSGEKEGKAEAEATQQSSRAVVSKRK